MSYNKFIKGTIKSIKYNIESKITELELNYAQILKINKEESEFTVFWSHEEKNSNHEVISLSEIGKYIYHGEVSFIMECFQNKTLCWFDLTRVEDDKDEGKKIKNKKVNKKEKMTYQIISIGVDCEK